MNRDHVRFRDRSPEVTFDGLGPYWIALPAPTPSNRDRKAFLETATFSLPDGSTGYGMGRGYAIKKDGTKGDQIANYIHVKWTDIPRHFREDAIEQFHEWQAEVARQEVTIDGTPA